MNVHAVPYVKWVQLSVAALSLNACAFNERIADHAVEYNKTFEDSANEIILLNVLRARDRKPMHFSRFSTIRGAFSLSGSSSISGNFPVGLNSTTFNLSPNLSVSPSTSPSFEVGVLDTQKFMQGILQPLKLQVIDYYLQQGWPKEILLHLFVRQIEFEKGTPNDSTFKRTVVENYPPNPDKMKDFQSVVRAWKDEFQVTAQQFIQSIGPDLSLTDKTKLPDLVNVHVAGLELRKEGSFYRLRKPSSKVVFCVGSREFCILEEIDIDKDKEVAALENDTRGQSKRGPIMGDQKERRDAGIEAEITTFQSEDVIKDIEKIIKFAPDRAIIHVRSVEGVIFYLGQIVEAYENVDSVVNIQFGFGGVSRPLFLLKKETEAKVAAEMVINYEGINYVVERNTSADEQESGRTMHVLSLVTQLLALQKSSDEIPRASAVTVVQ